MKITCPKCKTRLLIPDDKLKPGGIKFKCSSCGASLAYKKKEQQSVGDSSPDSGPPPPPASAEETVISPPLPDLERPPLQESSPPAEERRPEPVVPAAAEAPEQERFQERDQEKEAKKVARDAAPPAQAGSRISRNAILAVSGAVLFVIVLAVVFLFKSDNKEAQRPAPMQPSANIPLPESGPSVAPAPAPAPGSPGTAAPSLPAFPALPSEMTDEKAIETVKQSDALLPRTSVRAIVNKWAADNAARYSIVGWQAKKMDEQNYLVSYTARDGDKTTGFYFNLDVQTGAVQDIARNKELQAKYNINYGN